MRLLVITLYCLLKTLHPVPIVIPIDEILYKFNVLCKIVSLIVMVNALMYFNCRVMLMGGGATTCTKEVEEEEAEVVEEEVLVCVSHQDQPSYSSPTWTLVSQIQTFM